MLKAWRAETRERKISETGNCSKNFKKEKNEERKVHTIASAELNKFLEEFIRSVRRKDGEDYEPSSSRCLVSSIERHLTKNEKQFELARKSV